MILTFIAETVTRTTDGYFYPKMIVIIGLMMAGLYFAINSRLLKIQRKIKQLGSQGHSGQRKFQERSNHQISERDWNDEKLSLILADPESLSSFKVIPKFASKIEPLKTSFQSRKNEVWFMIENDFSDEKVLQKTWQDLKALGVGTIHGFSFHDRKITSFSHFENQNQATEDSFDTIGDDALVYLVRPGERLLPRAVEEHLSRIGEDWDVILAPFSGKHAEVKSEHIGVHPTVIRGHVWKDLLKTIRGCEGDTLAKRTQVLVCMREKRLRHLYSPIPAVDQRSVWEEWIPSAFWFLQEYALTRYSADSKTRDCFGIHKSQLRVNEERRSSLAQCRRDGVKGLRVVSGRIDKIFSPTTRNELTTFFKREHGIDAMFCKPEEVLNLEEGEVLILLVHLCQGERELLERIHSQSRRGQIISWFWDNHHMAALNLTISKLSDFVCAGHSHFSSYLSEDGAIALDPVELCVTQWTACEARRYFREPVAQERKVVGGFVAYDKARERNHIVRVFQDALPDQSIRLFPDEPGQGYFAMTPSERFLDWRHHSVSLCVPLFCDLSQRYFDALLTGQTPLVVGNLPDLEKLLARGGPEAAWTIYANKNSWDLDSSTAKQLAQEALDHFEAGGLSLATARHQFTVQNHMFVNRIERIFELWLENTHRNGRNAELAPPLAALLDSIRQRKGKSLRTVVNVQHGLGNRMRAYASARVLADMRGGDFELYWIPDHHCEADFPYLFANQENLVDQLPTMENQRDWAVYNLVDLEQTPNWQEPVDLDPSPNILVTSQRRLHFSTDLTAEEDEVLRMLRPSARVEEKMGEIGDVRHFVGVHIRMEGGADTSKATYDDPAQWDKTGQEAMFHWRAKSHWTNFVAEMRKLVEAEPQLNFFVASDQDFVIDKLKEEFGGKIHSITRKHFDRSPDQIVEGMADIYLLSRCRSILASNWSSFSEIAIRIGGKTARYAGIDF